MRNTPEIVSLKRIDCKPRIYLARAISLAQKSRPMVKGTCILFDLRLSHLLALGGARSTLDLGLENQAFRFWRGQRYMCPDGY